MSKTTNREHKKQSKKAPSHGLRGKKREPLFIITLSMFSAARRLQATSIHRLIECGCFLFSRPRAMKNTLTAASSREVNQTGGVRLLLLLEEEED